MLAILRKPFLDFLNDLDEDNIDDLIEIFINYVDYVEFGKHDIMIRPHANVDEE
jgi:hemerythrin-like domain-containing protein